MVSLAATIAGRRIYYPRPLASLPDLLMIHLPRRFARKGVPLGRFHPIMIETHEEQSEVETFLAEDRESLVSPDPLDERPSTFPRKHLTIAHYGPSELGWPFVQLCQWPADFAARASSEHRPFARAAYTFELFLNRRRLERASKALLGSLDPRHAIHVQIVFPDWSAGPGTWPN